MSRVNDRDASNATGSSPADDKAIERLLEAIYDRFGYDFRDYSRAHVRRRIAQRLQLSRLDSIGTLEHRVLHNPGFVGLLLKDLSINVTEMFRDPDFFLTLRERVVPLLKTWSFVKIWHAGCSTGEEVYSTAILLMEEGLYDRVQIYATDFNQQVLDQAREGIFPAAAMQKYARNYQLSGARASFSDFYHARYDSAIMDPALKKNILWAAHNLVTDSDFAEVQLVLCRNVLIYFGKDLQNRVHGLFHRSLANGGFLCLGRKECLSLTDYEGRYTVVDRQQKIFRKKYL
jgi:chemotaxis protein methyltransferase CheR